MARPRWQSIALVFVLLLGQALSAIQMSPKKIGDVLKVDVREYGKDPLFSGSCLRRLGQGLNGNTDFEVGSSIPPIYNPDAPFGQSPENPLNNIWFQMYTMVTQTRAALQNTIFSSNMEVMKLVYSFWGLKPAPPGQLFPAGTKHRLPGFYGLSFGQKFDLIRSRLQQYQIKMEEVPQTELKKAKVFCDGAYFTLQTANNWVVDSRGIRIKKPDGVNYYTIGEWESLHGRDANDRWFFFYKMGSGERGDEGGMGAWAQADHIILCPSSFLGNLDQQDESLNQQQPEGKHLDLMGIVALTFGHEFMHYCFPDNSIDYPPCFPVKDKRGTVSPKFPYYKSGWDCEKQSWGVYGAGQAMTLARYEIAGDDNGQPTTDLAEMLSWRTPEVYAWFMRTMLLTIKNRQDWSTGAARAFGSSASGVTAIIPERAGALQPRTAIAEKTTPSGLPQDQNVTSWHEVQDEEPDIAHIAELDLLLEH